MCCSCFITHRFSGVCNEPTVEAESEGSQKCYTVVTWAIFTFYYSACWDIMNWAREGSFAQLCYYNISLNSHAALQRATTGSAASIHIPVHMFASAIVRDVIITFWLCTSNYVCASVLAGQLVLWAGKWSQYRGLVYFELHTWEMHRSCFTWGQLKSCRLRRFLTSYCIGRQTVLFKQLLLWSRCKHRLQENATLSIRTSIYRRRLSQERHFQSNK